jgi:predicted ATP-grasp superfamily ATP-dependent carboligase
LTLPPLSDSEGEYVQALAAIVREGRYEMLIPGSDQALRAISANRAQLEAHVLLALPPHEVVLRSLDKLALARSALAAGLPCPETAVCSGVEQALAAAEALSYPVLIKPQHVVTELGPSLERHASLRVNGPEELARRVPVCGDACLVQSAASGEVVSYAGVRAGGSMLAVAMSRYSRTWPPSAGPNTFSVSAEPPAGLTERTGRLLDDIGWEGMFQLQLIHSSGDSFSVIDLNPRPYGSLSLAIAAGANIPAVWTEWALGGSPQPVTAAPGYSYRWEDGDFRCMIWNFRRRRLRAAADVLRPRRHVSHAYFRSDDPLPFVARMAAVIQSGRTGNHACLPKAGL